MAKFLLLLRGGDAGTRDYTPEQFQQLVQMYDDWAARLHREGRIRGGERLGNGGHTVRVRDGETIVDGPYAETKENIGGYFLIETDDVREAAEIAKGCPILNHGGLVDVREVIER